MTRPSPLDRLLGWCDSAPGEVDLQPPPALLNHRAGVHGAALSALLEAAVVSAARAQGPAWQDARTLDLHVSFLQPGQGLLRARARVTGGGRTLCFCEAVILDAEGRAVAQGLATLATAAGPIVAGSPIRADPPDDVNLRASP